MVEKLVNMAKGRQNQDRATATNQVYEEQEEEKKGRVDDSEEEKKSEEDVPFEAESELIIPRKVYQQKCFYKQASGVNKHAIFYVICQSQSICIEIIYWILNKKLEI